MKAFLLDIDGTTLLGSQALPGAIAFVRDLRARQIPFLWVTNNTSLSKASWIDRLERAGLDPRPDEVYTAGDATIDYLLAQDPVPRVYLVGTADLRAAFEEAGLVLAEENVDAVVLGYDTELTYEKIRRAALLLQRGLPFYATHPDMTCPTPAGPIPDVGSFLAMFQAACGRVPQVLGKPQPTMAHGALARLGVRPEEAVMVGDRLETDIRMAQAVGMRSCLVLTGVTTGDTVSTASPAPTWMLDSLAALHELLRETPDED
jgi:NagD protein